MQFPYGLSDFGTLIEGGYRFQDRTDRLAALQAAALQLIFQRPRRKRYLPFDDRLSMAVSELETERGDVDLALIVRPDMRHLKVLDLLLEFKSLSLKELGTTGGTCAGSRMRRSPS